MQRRHDPTFYLAFRKKVVPMLRTARAFREHYNGPTLRDQLGLGHPANRYAAIA